MRCSRVPDLDWLTRASETLDVPADPDRIQRQRDTHRTWPNLCLNAAARVLTGSRIGIDSRWPSRARCTSPRSRGRTTSEASSRGTPALLRAVPAWTLRLVFPRPLDRVYDAYQTVIREELETPLHPATIRELKWYFEHRRKASRGPCPPADSGLPGRRREGVRRPAVHAAVPPLVEVRRCRLRGGLSHP